MSSLFDPESFLKATLTEPTVKRDPLPVGDYVALIEKIDAKSWSKEGKSGVFLEVALNLQIPPDTQALLKITESSLKSKDSIFLDINSQGNLDTSPDKNKKLGMYRNAVDMNKVGDTFSPEAMLGRTILVKIAHRVTDIGIFENVAGVAKLA